MGTKGRVIQQRKYVETHVCHYSRKKHRIGKLFKLSDSELGSGELGGRGSGSVPRQREQSACRRLLFRAIDVTAWSRGKGTSIVRDACKAIRLSRTAERQTTTRLESWLQSVSGSVPAAGCSTGCAVRRLCAAHALCVRLARFGRSRTADSLALSPTVAHS